MFITIQTTGDAVGKTVVLKEFDDSKHNVIGVVNDYHQVSFKKPLEPVLFLCKPYEGEYYSMRVNTNDLVSFPTAISFTNLSMF